MSLQPSGPPHTFPSVGFSETAMAEAFINRYGDLLRYHPIEKLWLTYNGAVWRRDHRGVIVETGKQNISDSVNAALELGDLQLARKVLEYHSSRRLHSVLTLAQSITGVPILPHELDANPNHFNTRTHTLDLATGMPMGHDPRHLVSKLAPVDYDPEAQCPRWLAFLQRIFAGDTELIASTQRIVGSMLAGEIRENVFLVFWGAGANGKSTFINVIQKLLGEYAATIKADVLLERHLDPQGFQLADLPGVRMVTAVETGRDGKLNEALVKAMTGRDRIKVAHKYGHPFEFTPVFKPILVTNHKPGIGGQDHAIWRRVKLIPFDVTIPEAEQDPALADSMIDGELSGILNWALDGCYGWKGGGYQFPEAVTKATAEYRAEQDVLGDWLEDRCVLRPDLEDDFAGLYSDYGQWCIEQKELPLTKTKFALSLSERGCVLIRRGKARRRRGIARLATVPTNGHHPILAESQGVLGDGLENSQIQHDGLRTRFSKGHTCARRESFGETPPNPSNPSLPQGDAANLTRHDSTVKGEDEW